MKTVLLIFSLLFVCFVAKPQQKIVAGTEEKNMSQGQQMAVTITIPEAKIKDVEPLWKKYINNRGFGEKVGTLAANIGNIFRSKENQVEKDKISVETKGDEWYIRSIEEYNISSHSMDVYARATELPDGCIFSAFFQFTDSVFINESNVDQERIQSMKTFIHDFGVEVYTSVVDDQIKEAEKEVSKQQGELKDIESDTRKEEKAISRYKSDIDEYEEGIKEIENDIARQNETIEAKKLAFATVVKDDPSYIDKKDELKFLSKEKAKNFRKIKSLKSRIKSKEQDIKSSKKAIAQNDNKETEQQKVIDEKQKFVDQLETKKAGIQ